MKKLLIKCSVLAVMAVIGVSYLQADDPPVPALEPSKVTGGGVIQDGYYDENWEFQFGDNFHLFSMTINPEKPAGRKSPQANIRLASPSVKELWGGPLSLRGDPDFSWVVDWFGPESKPGQIFRFILDHPDHGEVAVLVFVHDNLTPGLNSANPSWSDWVMVWIEEDPEPIIDPYEPPSPDGHLILVAGIVVRGNIMDHREGYVY